MAKPPITDMRSTERTLDRGRRRGSQYWPVRVDGPCRISAGGESQEWTNRHTRACIRRVGPQVWRTTPQYVQRVYLSHMEQSDKEEYANSADNIQFTNH